MGRVLLSEFLFIIKNIDLMTLILGGSSVFSINDCFGTWKILKINKENKTNQKIYRI